MKRKWNLPPDQPTSAAPVLFFAIAFMVFLASQLYITAAPFFQRELPVEADDAFGIIVKAEEMRVCFWQDCPALEELRSQLLAPTLDIEIAYSQLREYHRLFVVYHPLHSAALQGLASAGLSYETGYSIIAIAAKVILCAGIAYWLKILFGFKPAALALILLAPVVWPGTGLHTMVPSTMALAAAFFLWGFSLSKNKYLHWILVPGVLVLVSLHQIGRIYAGTALLNFLLYSANLHKRRDQLILGIGSTLFFASFALPMVVSSPELNFDPSNFYLGWDYFENLVPANIASLGIVSTWLNAFTFTQFGLLLTGFGMFLLWKRKQYLPLFMGGLLLIQLILGLVYVVPWFEAISFQRVWVPAAVFLTAALAFGIDSAFASTWSWLKQLDLSKINLKRLQGFQAVGFLVLGLFVVSMVTYIPFNLRHYGLTLNNQIDRQNFSMNPIQPSLVPTSAKRILYTREVPLYYYLTYGGLNHGAVYYPVIAGTPSEAEWLSEVDYAVVDSPIGNNGILQISSGSHLDIHFGEKQVNEFWLYVISNDAETLELQVSSSSSDGASPQIIQLPANFHGWLPITYEAGTGVISITTSTISAIDIIGLKTNEMQRTYWPWATELLLETVSITGEMDSYLLNVDSLSPVQALRLEVIDDQGSTILAKVIPDE